MRAYDGIEAERGCEVTLETPDFLDQARQLLSKNVPIQIQMSGSSMRPAIEDGDMIMVEPINDSILKPGDIILYNSVRDTAVIHRVVRVERGSSNRAIVTRGDAASQNDIALPMHRVLGRVKQIERAGERVNMARPRFKLPYKLLGWLSRLKFWA